LEVPRQLISSRSNPGDQPRAPRAQGEMVVGHEIDNDRLLLRCTQSFLEVILSRAGYRSFSQRLRGSQAGRAEAIRRGRTYEP
jgi:hypothetical protein